MNAFPMIQRCKNAQWRGFTPDEQAYMTSESERGFPVFLSLGHQHYNIWKVEHEDRPEQPGDYLISIKVDLWPSETIGGF